MSRYRADRDYRPPDIRWNAKAHVDETVALLPSEYYALHALRLWAVLVGDGRLDPVRGRGFAESRVRVAAQRHGYTPKTIAGHVRNIRAACNAIVAEHYVEAPGSPGLLVEERTLAEFEAARARRLLHQEKGARGAAVTNTKLLKSKQSRNGPAG